MPKMAPIRTCTMTSSQVLTHSKVVIAIATDDGVQNSQNLGNALQLLTHQQRGCNDSTTQCSIPERTARVPPPAKGCNNGGAMTLLHSVAYWRGQLECPHQPRSCNNGGAMTQCSILERTARVPPPAKGCNNGGAMTLLYTV